MSVEQTRSKITARIWQSIAQSGVPVDVIPREQLETLVSAISDGVLVAVDEALDEAGLPSRHEQTAAALGSEEQILWEGRPFLSMVDTYRITSERVRITRGLLGKEREDIELIRIQDIDQTQNLGERALNIGDITIRSADPSKPEVVLRNVTHPVEVHEILRRAMLDARKRFRYSIHEEM